MIGGWESTRRRSPFFESASKERIRELMAMEPRELGRRINVTGTAVTCPVCRIDGPMAVHEHGVQFSCGCCRRLPPLHGGDRHWAACGLCNRGTVIPIHRGMSREEIRNRELRAHTLRRVASR